MQIQLVPLLIYWMCFITASCMISQTVEGPIDLSSYCFAIMLPEKEHVGTTSKAHLPRPMSVPEVSSKRCYA